MHLQVNCVILLLMVYFLQFNSTKSRKIRFLHAPLAQKEKMDLRLIGQSKHLFINPEKLFKATTAPSCCQFFCLTFQFAMAKSIKFHSQRQSHITDTI